MKKSEIIKLVQHEINFHRKVKHEDINFKKGFIAGLVHIKNIIKQCD